MLVLALNNLHLRDFELYPILVRPTEPKKDKNYKDIKNKPYLYQNEVLFYS